MTTKRADDKATTPPEPVPGGPGVATTADIQGPAGTPLGETGAQEPVELTHPITSGGPEAWSIPRTPSNKADIEAAKKHAQKEAERLAETGHLPPALAREGPAPKKGEKDRYQKIRDAKAKVHKLNAEHPITQQVTAAHDVPELPPPPTARAVQMHSVSRWEMQANGVTDDLLANADGLGVDRHALLESQPLRDAVQDYIDAVRQNV